MQITRAVYIFEDFIKQHDCLRMRQETTQRQDRDAVEMEELAALFFGCDLTNGPTNHV